MNTQARVSVLTPSFNQARYLPANLDSVRAQGAVIREHLVVDGGSQDGSVEVLRAHQHPALWWSSERDRGQSDALNKALRRAQGDVIGWLNSDDTYCPSAAERAVELLDADPRLGMVFGHCHKIDSEGRIIGRVNAAQVTLEDMLSYSTIPQPSCFVRREVIERAGGIDDGLRYAMDYDLWLRIGLRGVPWLAVDEAWACFRLHDLSKSSSEIPRFYPEIERAMEQALASPLLPAGLTRRRAELRRRFHTSIAIAAYANLDLPRARAHFRRALAADPRGLDGRLLQYFAKSLLSQRLVVASRRVKQAVGLST